MGVPHRGRNVAPFWRNVAPLERPLAVNLTGCQLSRLPTCPDVDCTRSPLMHACTHTYNTVRAASGRGLAPLRPAAHGTSGGLRIPELWSRPHCEGHIRAHTCLFSHRHICMHTTLYPDIHTHSLSHSIAHSLTHQHSTGGEGGRSGVSTACCSRGCWWVAVS